MKNYEWLCNALLQLDEFAEEQELFRFRAALSTAADAAIEDIGQLEIKILKFSCEDNFEIKSI